MSGTRNRLLEGVLVDLIDRTVARVRNSPLFLGGGAGPNGGVGGPPSGFVGKLLQTSVTYDTSESATLSTSTSPSLLDNLNHIRARVGGFNQVGLSLEDELIERIWFMGQ